MPFVQMNIQSEIEKIKKQDPEFEKMWEESREEYRLIGEMISLRKQQNITQSKLAKISGNTQQTISLIEKHERIPSIRVFSRLLNSLGYELKIVKKANI